MERLKRRIAKLLVSILTLFAFSHPVLAAPIELTLADSISLALKNNKDIKISTLARDKAVWVIKQEEAGKGVSLNLNHSARRSDSAGGDPATNFSNNVSLSVPIYSGGKLESQIDQAKLELKIADLGLDATMQQTKQNVTTYYFNVLQYRNEAQINRETVDNYTAHLKDVQAKYEIGTVAKTDVLASQVSLATAQDDLIKAENNYNVAVATLNNAIGLSLDSELTLKEGLKYEKNSLTLEDCVKYALANHPEIAEYQTKIASAEDDVKIAKSGDKPTVDFAVGQSWYDKDFPGANNSNWQATITASFNLFDSGLNKSRVQQSQYSLATAQEAADQKRDTVLLDVRQYYLSMREAEKRIDTNQVAVNQAQENLKIQEARYSAGVGTNLDVLDAVLHLNQTKINDIQALYDYNTSKAQLDKAMGVPVQ
ncbi:MAG TPA: TolC family protein [Methylomusa anaerophila]|uniref:Outer membrane protein TolC n=1 Tax=Methylomusa anaerophila TaxID=1930071 RepID=A0A348AM86_9FIRM|nr:TolC family protein [Methylomusa anaerophila]BBB92184.1 outer membrane protein TolC precursor [Methylomusa anaerophila]HML87802.1 TolC family protein [Methylomusa anaerophila]